MSFKSQIMRVVLPAIEQHMKKMQPIIIEQVKKVQPALEEQIRKVQPVIEEQIKKMQPVIKEQMRKVQPAIEEQMKKVVPWIQQQLAASQSQTNPYHNFPVNWDVDDKVSEDGKYKLKLNVKDYSPENIKVKVVQDKIVVEGDHKEKSINNKEQGMSETYLSRGFVTEFQLPDDVSTKDVQSKVGDGFVTISALKKSPQKSKTEERVSAK